MVTANTNSGELTQALSLPTTGLNGGFQNLTIRAFDDQGQWGLYEKSTFYIIDDLNLTGSDTPSNIANAEYWFDDDSGNSQSLTISGSPSSTTESYVIPIGNLGAGFHNITVRVQNNDGIWSLYSKRSFYVIDDLNLAGSNTASNIAGAEYWFDDDSENSQPLIISGSPNSTSENYIIPINNLDGGFHNLSLRVQNQDGIWSLYSKRTFYVIDDLNLPGSDTESNIAEAEYWFDDDSGNSQPLTISGSPNSVTQSFVIPFNNLGVGFHKLTMRVKNENGHWSLYDRRAFYIFENSGNESIVSPLSEVEFLYDAELGFGTGTALAFTATGNPDEYVIEIPTDLVTCDIHDIWLSMKNEAGNYALYEVLKEVEVFDNAPPTITTFPNITAELNASGQASITIADVDNGTFDDCELVSVVLNQTQFDYTCANLGENTVTITATDAEAKVSSEDVTVTVVDNIEPVAVTQNITAQLDGSGNVTIIPSDIENDSTDNCSVTGYTLDVTSFNCSNLGANTVILTVTDSSGNSNTASATVTVEDNIKPKVATQAFTVQLNASGNAIITATDVDNGSIDNCTIVSRSLDISSFTCANLGNNTITLTVTDQSGNADTATAIVTVEDGINPTVVTQNITVQLNASGNAAITASQIDNGSSDNCAIASTSLNVTNFTCADLGSNTVTLYVTDSSGNASSNTANVTVEDNINPVAITKAFTAQLDANGTTTITVDDVDNNSSDNCSITSRSLDISSFTCANIGANTVMLTVEDASGNINTASAMVTVEDSINPITIGQDIIRDLGDDASVSITANEVDNGSSDNCNFTLSIDVNTFDTIGIYPVVLTSIDGSGNTSSTSINVTIVDSTLSVAKKEISEDDIKLYPVPTADYLNISTPLRIDVLTIYDLNGKQIRLIKNPPNKININHLQTGMYFLKFNIEDVSIQKQIIKK